MRTPLTSPAARPQPRPTMTGTITGRSIAQSPKMALGLGLPFTTAVCAKLIAIMAVAPTTEPEERSMPPVMITWVTPTAMMPMIETCRMMMFSRLHRLDRADGAFVVVGDHRVESGASGQPVGHEVLRLVTAPVRGLLVEDVQRDRALAAINHVVDVLRALHGGLVRQLAHDDVGIGLGLAHLGQQAADLDGLERTGIDLVRGDKG